MKNLNKLKKNNSLAIDKSNNICKNILKFIINNPVPFLLIILITITILFKPYFLSWRNFTNTIADASLIGIIGVGMTFVIIGRGIDLSVGSVMALTCVGVATFYSKLGVPIVFSIILNLIFAAAIGCFIGLLITKFMIPPFLSSLAMMLSIVGIARLWSGAQAIGGLPENFTKLWLGNILYIPMPVWIWAIIVIVGIILEKRNNFGKYCYAIGANPKAAYYSGVPVHWTYIKAFAFNGFLAGIAGILSAARFGSGEPLTGRGYEFLVITAVVIGGTSLLGGKGSTYGTIFGALTIAFLRTIMSFWGFMIYWQNFAIGVILIVMVWISALREKR